MTYSENFKKIVSKAKELATKKITNDDLFFGILFVDNSIAYKVYKMLIDDKSHQKYQKLYNEKLYILNSDVNNIQISNESKNILEQCQLEARKFNSNDIKSEHLLLALCRASYFKEFKYQDVEKIINNNNRNMNAEYENQNPEQTNSDKVQVKGGTPTLDQFSTDLTKLAKEGKLDPVVGRVRELKRVVQILSRRRKNNPVIIGDAGCVNEDTLITIKKVSEETNHNIIFVKKLF